MSIRYGSLNGTGGGVKGFSGSTDIVITHFNQVNWRVNHSYNADKQFISDLKNNKKHLIKDKKVHIFYTKSDKFLFEILYKKEKYYFNIKKILLKIIFLRNQKKLSKN